MKKLIILILLLFCIQLPAKDIGMFINLTGGGAGVVPGNAKSVLYIFSNPCVILIAGATFDGTVDKSLLLEAPAGDTIAAQSYFVSSGTLRIVRTY